MWVCGMGIVVVVVGVQREGVTEKEERSELQRRGGPEKEEEGAEARATTPIPFQTTFVRHTPHRHRKQPNLLLRRRRLLLLTPYSPLLILRLSTPYPVDPRLTRHVFATGIILKSRLVCIELIACQID
jgi:hypothetical protein